jgi:hypothetical protein
MNNNDTDYISRILEYHILIGSRMVAQLTPGVPDFIPTLLTDPAFANVAGGQRVENVEQGGGVAIVGSGKGTRSTVVQSVSSLSIYPRELYCFSHRPPKCNR